MGVLAGDEDIRLLALEDEDLRPLWDWLANGDGATSDDPSKGARRVRKTRLDNAHEMTTIQASASSSRDATLLDKLSENLFQLDLRGRVNVRGVQKFIQNSG